MKVFTVFLHFTIFLAFTDGYHCKLKRFKSFWKYLFPEQFHYLSYLIFILVVCLHNACAYNNGQWECEHRDNQVVDCGDDGICAEFSQFGKIQPSEILEKRRCIKKSTIADHEVRERLRYHQDFCKVWHKAEYKQKMCFCHKELCNHMFRLPEDFVLMKNNTKHSFRQASASHHH